MNAAIFLILLTLSKCGCSLEVTVEEKEVVTRIGEEVELKCKANSGKVGCSFTSPLGKSFIMNNKHASDERGRIQAVDTRNHSDCAMKITEIKQSDNGNWRCNVTCTNCDKGKYDVGVNFVNVIVVVPVAEVYLTVNNKRITNSIEMDLEKTKETSIKCIAAGANPRPKFEWFLNDTELNSAVASKENVEDGKVNYISTLTYKGNSTDFVKELKCSVSQKHQVHGRSGAEINEKYAFAKMNLRYDTSIISLYYKLLKDIYFSFPCSPFNQLSR